MERENTHTKRRDRKSTLPLLKDEQGTHHPKPNPPKIQRKQTNPETFLKGT